MDIIHIGKENKGVVLDVSGRFFGTRASFMAVLFIKDVANYGDVSDVSWGNSCI
jgi:hypothetical protein